MCVGCVTYMYNSEFSLFGIKCHCLQKYLTQAQMFDLPTNDFNYENEKQMWTYNETRLCDKWKLTKGKNLRFPIFAKVLESLKERQHKCSSIHNWGQKGVLWQNKNVAQVCFLLFGQLFQAIRTHICEVWVVWHRCTDSKTQRIQSPLSSESSRGRNVMQFNVQFVFGMAKCGCCGWNGQKACCQYIPSHSLRSSLTFFKTHFWLPTCLSPVSDETCPQ